MCPFQNFFLAQAKRVFPVRKKHVTNYLAATTELEHPFLTWQAQCFGEGGKSAICSWQERGIARLLICDTCVFRYYRAVSYYDI